MDFTLSEEQQLLKDSVERFVRENYELSQRREQVASADGFSREHWATMAELGWLGAAMPEEYGGVGGGAIETMVIMEGFGNGLVVEPYFATAVLGGNLVLQGGSKTQKNALLPALVEGKLMLAFAYAEPQARYDLHDVETTAQKQGGGHVLNGRKGVVLHGGTADKLVVSARTAGGTRDRDGITLFLVDRDAEGVTLRDYQTIDGLRAAELELDNVAIGADGVLGDIDGGIALIEDTARRGMAALAAEAVGVMDRMQALTNEYLQTREQFGRPLGKFQLLQHRMVDILIACEESRSAMLVANLRVDDGGDASDQATTAAKVKIGQSGRLVGQSAIQLHGGMGMTDEIAIGHYFKRLAMIDLMFGDHTHHLKHYAAR